METKPTNIEAEGKAWLTVPEVAEELRIPRTRAYTLIQQGVLPAVRIGEKSIRVNRRDLEEYLFRNCRVVEA